MPTKKSRYFTSIPPQKRLTIEDLEELAQGKDFSPLLFDMERGLTSVQSNYGWMTTQTPSYKGVTYASRAIKFFWETGTWPDQEEARPHFWRYALSYSVATVPTPILAPDLILRRRDALAMPVRVIETGHGPEYRFARKGIDYALPQNWYEILNDPGLKDLQVIETIKALRRFREDRPAQFRSFMTTYGVSGQERPWWAAWSIGKGATLGWEGDYTGALMGTAGVPEVPTPYERLTSGEPVPSVSGLLGYHPSKAQKLAGVPDIYRDGPDGPEPVNPTRTMERIEVERHAVSATHRREPPLTMTLTPDLDASDIVCRLAKPKTRRPRRHPAIVDRTEEFERTVERSLEEIEERILEQQEQQPPEPIQSPPDAYPLPGACELDDGCWEPVP